MSTLDTLTTIASIVTNPFVIAAATALGTVALGVAAYTIKTKPGARDIAQDVADLAEELEPWVITAEKTILRGEAKYSTVLDQAEAWLAEQGITGQRGRVIKKYLPLLIEATVKRVTAQPAPDSQKAAG